MVASKARVSLCMIVRNEEQNLRECLAPVAHLFDEIVIVDTGSQDATKAIAGEFTPHVFDFPWCDDFSAARNESVRRATGEWIFWLDADDRVSPDQIARLRELLAKLDDSSRIFLMETVLKQSSLTEDTLVVSHPRLFRRHAEMHWEGRVHEQLRPEPRTLGYEWIFTDIRIDHIGYADRAHADRKAHRKLRLMRMDYAVDPENPSTLLHLGIALAGRGSFGEARKFLLRIAELVAPTHPCMRRVYCALSELALHQGNPAEAAQIAACGLEHFPDDVFLMYEQASAFYKQENYVATTALLEQIMTYRPKKVLLIGEPADVISKLAPRMLGAALRMQREYERAGATLLQLLKHFPDDVSTWYNLGLVYLDQGSGAKLTLLVRQLMTMAGGKTDASTLTALWHLRHGNLITAGALIDQLVAEVPREPLPRMLRVEWLSRRQAPWTEQIRALNDLLRIQPGNLEAKHWVERIEAVQAGAIA